MRTVVRAMGGVALGCFALTGCSFSFDADSAPIVSKAALQDDISKRLTDAGEKPQSVTCKDDLVGEVGKITRCEVVISATNSFEPIVKVTGVEGDSINYEMTPALSKVQVENAVKGLVEDAAGYKVSSVSCASGLEGITGKTTSCQVDAPAGKSRWDVEIDEVRGLLMNFQVYPVISQDSIEGEFLDRIDKELGRRPDTVTCTGDLVGKTGSTIDCNVVVGGQPGPFTLTVTGVDGGIINYRFDST